MLFVARRTGIVGSEEAGGTVPIEQLAQIGGAGEDVVVRIIWVGAEAVAGTQSSLRFRHDLHQAHCSLGRQSTHVAEALDLHHGAYPLRGNAEPLRGFGDEGGEWMGRRGDVVRLRGDRFGVSNAAAEQQTPPRRRPKGGSASERAAADARRRLRAAARLAGKEEESAEMAAA